MGLAKGCLRCILVVTNILLILIAIICLGLGIFMMTALSGIVNNVLGPSLAGAKSMTNQFDYLQGAEGSAADDDGELDITPLVEPVATFLIVIGIIMLIIAVLGVVGACCDLRIILIVYAIVLAVVILVELIMIILLFTKGLDELIRNQVQKKLIEPYKGTTHYSATSLAANGLMYHFQCCGIDSYEDFSEAKDWKTDYTVTRHGFIKNIKLKTPVVCCKSKSTSTGGGGSPNNSTVVQSNCAEAPTDANSNWKTSCWNKVTQELEPHRDSAIGVSVVIFIVQVAFLVIAVVIICLQTHNKISV